MSILPSLPLAVGILGHRELGEHKEGIRAIVAALLTDIRTHATTISRQCHADCPDIFYEPPRLCCNSCLCAGTDQLAAIEALRLGYELKVLLPFSCQQMQENERHMGPLEQEASARLDELLAQARQVLEPHSHEWILGSDVQAKDARQQAYHEAGTRLVQASDLLIAVWRGDRHCSLGTTSALVHLAREQGIPVIWVHSAMAQDPVLLSTPDGSWQPAFTHLSACMEQHFGNVWKEPTQQAQLYELSQCLKAVYGHHDDRFCLAKGLRSHYASLWKRFERYWRHPSPVTNDQAVSLEDRSVTFHLFDTLAITYAHLYRSSLLVGCTAGTLAIMCATLAILSPCPPLHYAACVAELLILLGLIGNYALSTGKHWQQRFTNTRFVAECLRCQCYVHLYGYSLSRFSGQQYNKDDNAWPHWLARCLIREYSLNPLNLPQGREDSKANITHLLTSQSRYHQGNAARCGAIYDTLHRMTSWLFGLTFVVVVLELLPGPPLWKTLLGFTSIACPVLAMAAHILCHYTELKRLQQRSQAMHEQLDHLHACLQQASPVDEANIVMRTVHLMLQESADWKVQYNIPDIVLA